MYDLVQSCRYTTKYHITHTSKTIQQVCFECSYNLRADRLVIDERVLQIRTLSEGVRDALKIIVKHRYRGRRAVAKRESSDRAGFGFDEKMSAFSRQSRRLRLRKEGNEFPSADPPGRLAGSASAVGKILPPAPSLPRQTGDIHIVILLSTR